MSRERILRTALAFVDEHGLEGLTMRRIAQELGVEAMSLYNHVENKDDLVAGILDLVAAEVDPPPDDVEWKAALRRSALSAHEAFRRHRWAARIWMSASRPGPDRFAATDAVLRCFRRGGLSPELTYHALHVFHGYTLGYTLQQLEFPYRGQDLERMAERFLRDFPAETYPDLATHIEQHLEPHDSEPGSFELGLDLILDGLERMRE